MTEPTLLRAIYDRPEDDAVRLVYADWLDDHGEAERAEFIRVQCELEPVRGRYEDDRAGWLHAREGELLAKLQDKWEPEIVAILGHRPDYNALTFRRGFADTLTLPVQWYLEHGEAIHEKFPLLRRVELYRVNGWGARLSQFPVPAGVEELQVPCWIGGADAEAIAASPRLRHLSRLHFWLGNLEDDTADEAVCRALAACADWPRLTELRLTAFNADPEERPPAFETLAGAFRRPVVTLVDPWSRPYAFAPGGRFDSCFPGRLPSGEQTFVISPPQRPGCLVLLLFDPEGNPLGEREVVLPGDWVAPAYADWEARQKSIRRRAAFLRDTLGHRPGFIRVKELRWGENRLVHDYPYHFEEQMGWPDYPEQRPEEDDLHGPSGMGGLVHGWVSTGSFVFTGTGGDWWVDGSGHVGST